MPEPCLLLAIGRAIGEVGILELAGPCLELGFKLAGDLRVLGKAVAGLMFRAFKVEEELPPPGLIEFPFPLAHRTLETCLGRMRHENGKEPLPFFKILMRLYYPLKEK